jgi:hypothetical protein
MMKESRSRSSILASSALGKNGSRWEVREPEAESVGALCLTDSRADAEHLAVITASTLSSSSWVIGRPRRLPPPSQPRRLPIPRPARPCSVRLSQFAWAALARFMRRMSGSLARSLSHVSTATNRTPVCHRYYGRSLCWGFDRRFPVAVERRLPYLRLRSVSGSYFLARGTTPPISCCLGGWRHPSYCFLAPAKTLLTPAPRLPPTSRGTASKPESSSG